MVVLGNKFVFSLNFYLFEYSVWQSELWILKLNSRGCEKLLCFYFHKGTYITVPLFHYSPVRKSEKRDQVSQYI